MRKRGARRNPRTLGRGGCQLLSRLRSENGEHSEKYTSQRATDERSDHGNRRIGPIGATFPCNWKNRVRDARPEVSCRVDRISRWAPQRQTDAPDKASGEIRPES